MAKGYKIPKKIAGVRVPRPIRKSKLLRTLLRSPQNRLLASSLVVAAGGAAAAVLAQHRPAAEQVKDAAQDTGRLGRLTTGAMAEMVNRVTHSLASSLRASDDEKDDSAKRPVVMPTNSAEDVAGLP